MKPDLSLVDVCGDVSVVAVNPLALLRVKAGQPCGAAWQSTKDDSWTAWRPDREFGLVQRGFPSRLVAAMYLAAVI